MAYTKQQNSANEPLHIGEPILKCIQTAKNLLSIIYRNYWLSFTEITGKKKKKKSFLHKFLKKKKKKIFFT